MAARPTARTGCRSFGTGRGRRVLGALLSTAILSLPAASTALAYRAQPDGPTGGSPAITQPAAAQPETAQPEIRADPHPASPDGGRSALQTLLGRRQAAVTEKHITTLHQTLQVTPLQEPQWQTLATAMRDNVVALDRVYAAREASSGSMSALDDLKSYGLVQQVHARNVQNLLGPLQALYDSFSPSQKTRADDIFRRFTDNAVRNSR